MRYSSKTVEKLVNHYREISLLGKVNSLLSWDLNVNLPSAAGETRARQSAYITKLISDKWLDKDFRKELKKAQRERNLSEEEKAIVRNLGHNAKFYHRVPQEIIVEFSETTSRSFIAWRHAREKSEFKLFEPHLKKLVRLNQTIAKHIGYSGNPYDALLDMFEPGLTAKEGKVLFGSLVKEITPLLKVIKKSKTFNEKNDLFDKEYDVSLQKQLSEFVLEKIGYDFGAGRQDVSTHPFTTELGAGDVRITNRYSPHNFIESIMVAMHEGGHALYEQGINYEFDNTPLEGGVSLGIHESQSRFWENQIGRSREYVEYLEPVLKAFYPMQLGKESAESLYRVFNKVTPSFIRVEADEVTYNLHIALRFEIEEGLLSGKIKVEELPRIWNSRVKKYLGVTPKTDSEGVLQDVHWSHGLMGYFPTYTLGNLYAAQFASTMSKELDLPKLICEGNFGTILSWQRENIHKHGSLYWPKELVKRVTGKSLSANYFLDYLNEKYSDIYTLSSRHRKMHEVS
jgi:carboxypeptidase Taq